MAPHPRLAPGPAQRSSFALPRRRPSAPLHRPARSRLDLRLAATAVACGLTLAAAGPAGAGITLVSRQSDIRSSGGVGLEGQRQATGFDALADQVGNPDAPIDGRTAVAHQYALVGRLGASGAGLEGAFGEGQVRAQTTPGAAAAAAASAFDLTFSVEGPPSAFTLGASLGAASGGTAVVSLAPVVGGEAGDPIVESAIGPAGQQAGDGREVEQSGFLAPGQYLLHVRADGEDLSGTGGELTAYFNFSLMLSGTGVGGGHGGPPGGDPPPAVPLPPAVLMGGSLLGLIAGRRVFGRRR